MLRCIHEASPFANELQLQTSKAEAGMSYLTVISQKKQSFHLIGYATLFVGEPQIEAYANKMSFVGDTLNSFTSHLYI